MGEGRVEPLRVGLIGAGVGAAQLLPALTDSPHIRLAAAADARPAALDRLAQDTGCATYATVEALCGDAQVEAVWVATPNHLHAEHVIAAVEAGKHVIVSKPMAITLDEARAMNEAAERNHVYLLAGHTQSMAPTIRRMADMVRSGELGRLGMVQTWHCTDWMYRPRLPAELDVALGGGPVLRQASHQVDIVRFIAGGRVRSVRAQTVQLDPERGAPGAYTAMLTFADGVPATIVYSGYGHFDMAEVLGSAARETSRAPATAGATARRSPAQEAQMKDALRHDSARPATSASSLGLFGLTIVTCADGDIREAPEGLYVYRDGTRQLELVSEERRGQAELAELFGAVRLGLPIVHDGRWGEATLEVCIAIHESARMQSEVVLTRQTAVSV
ncbi:MAG: Gfo/Idh/MocA family oxidoreductase [Chloroflexota bacterium]